MRRSSGTASLPDVRPSPSPFLGCARRLVLLASLALAAPAAAGCAGGPVIEPTAGRPPFAYRVGPGDVLSVEVYDEPLLQREVTVTPDGEITFPLAGQIHAAGRSLAEIADAVIARLVKSGRFATPSALNLSVTLRESRSARVHVFGEVGRQGAVPFREGLSVADALAESGGIDWRTAKLEDCRVIRGRLDRPAQIEVDLEDVFAAAEKDVYLAPGDMVIVPAKWVTRMDRYVQQLLSPVSSLVGTARQGAATAVAP